MKGGFRSSSKRSTIWRVESHGFGLFHPDGTQGCLWRAGRDVSIVDGLHALIDIAGVVPRASRCARHPTGWPLLIDFGCCSRSLAPPVGSARWLPSGGVLEAVAGISSTGRPAAGMPVDCMPSTCCLRAVDKPRGYRPCVDRCRGFLCRLSPSRPAPPRRALARPVHPGLGSRRAIPPQLGPNPPQL